MDDEPHDPERYNTPETRKLLRIFKTGSELAQLQLAIRDLNARARAMLLEIDAYIAERDIRYVFYVYAESKNPLIGESIRRLRIDPILNATRYVVLDELKRLQTEADGWLEGAYEYNNGDRFSEVVDAIEVRMARQRLITLIREKTEEHTLAFTMGTHRRLGEASRLRGMDASIVRDLVRDNP